MGQLVDDILQLLPVAGSAGGKWMRSKSAQESAKEAEIRARVTTMIGELQIKRDQLVQDRENAKEAARHTETQEQRRHGERMYELETQRISAEAEALHQKTMALGNVVDAVKKLRELGVEVDFKVIRSLLPT